VTPEVKAHPDEWICLDGVPFHSGHALSKPKPKPKPSSIWYACPDNIGMGYESYYCGGGYAVYKLKPITQADLKREFPRVYLNDAW
jgi:hypothetical protein